MFLLSYLLVFCLLFVLFGVFSRSSAWGRGLETPAQEPMLTVLKTRSSKKFEICVEI